jgi:hypothetical protein
MNRRASVIDQQFSESNHRLASLERQLKILKVAFAVLLLAVVFDKSWMSISAAHAQEAPSDPEDIACKVLTARRVDIVDADGTRRGSWGLQETGEIAVTLQDAQKRTRFLSLVDKKGVAVSMITAPSGNGRISMQYSENGVPLITMVDANQKTRFLAGLPDGSPTIALADGRGVGRLVLAVTEQGWPVINLAAENGNSLIGMQVVGGNEPSITVDGQKGEFLSLSAADGLPRVTLHSSDKAANHLTIGEKPQQCITILDASGKAIWKAPE